MSKTNSTYLHGFAFLAVAGLLFFPATVSTMHTVYGNVYTQGDEPAVGVTVSAFIDGELRASYETVDAGEGYSSFFVLDVNGLTSEAGEEIYFTVEGLGTAKTVSFNPLDSSSVDLTASGPLPVSEETVLIQLTEGYNLISFPTL